MNKYSSKAVKTAATVGMSLAMVLSNAAPVFATAATVSSCATAVNGLEEFLKNGMGMDEFASANSETIVDMTDVMLDGLNAGTADKANLFILLSAPYTTEAKDDLYSYVTAAITQCTSSEPLRADAIKMRDTVKAYYEMFKGAGYGTTALVAGDLQLEKGTVASNHTTTFDGTSIDEIDMAKDGLLKTVFDKLVVDVDNTDPANPATTNGVYTTEGLKTKVNLTAARKDLKKLNDFYDDYADNLTSEEEGAFALVRDLLDANISEYVEDTDDEALANFVLSFDAVLQADLDQKTFTPGNTVKGATESIQEVTGWTNGDYIKLNSSSAIKSRMNKIKNHDRYDDFEDEDAVIAILDAYQALLDDISGTKDVFKSDSYTDYTKTKVANRDSSYDDITVKTLAGKFAKASELAKVINSDEFAILKAAKEDVMDELYTMETKKIGNYYVDKSGFVDTATASQQSTFKTAFPSYLWALADTETGEFGYDKVAARMEKVAADLKAVTTDIAKLTPVNIKASDKATLEAAEDAIYELTDKYKANLTADEYKEVRKAETKITNLREAFDNLGVTNVAGWYSMGNGDWGYNNEDGTPAAYKWVASGSDWYMIKDGKMLRNTWLATDGGRWYYLDNAGKMVTNQSVDGCWINSYGVYMSPSYNG